MRIRVCGSDDLTAVYGIQRKCPEAAQWLEKDYANLRGDPAVTFLAAELEPAGVIAGFAVFHRVIDEAELRNLAVDPTHRRLGVARALILRGLRIMHDSEIRRVFLEVRASNEVALLFYDSMGFRFLARRREYYHDPVEDALVMARDIPTALHS